MRLFGKRHRDESAPPQEGDDNLSMTEQTPRPATLAELHALVKQKARKGIAAVSNRRKRLFSKRRGQVTRANQVVSTEDLGHAARLVDDVDSIATNSPRGVGSFKGSTSGSGPNDENEPLCADPTLWARTRAGALDALHRHANATKPRRRAGGLLSFFF